MANIIEAFYNKLVNPPLLTRDQIRATIGAPPIQSIQPQIPSIPISQMINPVVAPVIAALMGGGQQQPVKQTTAPANKPVRTQPISQPSPVTPQVVPPQVQQVAQQQSQPQQTQQPSKGNINWGQILAQIGIPLATAGIGMGVPGALPGAAGFSQGYAGALDQQRTRQGEIDKYNAEQEPKRQEALLKAKEVETAARQQAEEMLSTIEKVKSMSKYFGWSSLKPGFPESEKRVFDKYFNNLKSKLVLNLMTTLKQASKTGSTGFGQLSEKELKILQDASTALDAGMPLSEATKILDDLSASATRLLGYSEPGGGDGQRQLEVYSVRRK